jgi:hypothetical protein
MYDVLAEIIFLYNHECYSLVIFFFCTIHAAGLDILQLIAMNRNGNYSPTEEYV